MRTLMFTESLCGTYNRRDMFGSATVGDGLDLSVRMSGTSALKPWVGLAQFQAVSERVLDEGAWDTWDRGTVHARVGAGGFELRH